mmetsp:Transcript_3848/g.5713  ORF Transcript_3848/g.5713 Transcript_3848/m.5713 type:complete len:285 (+) Transcript_3848:208-1062(+)
MDGCSIYPEKQRVSNLSKGDTVYLVTEELYTDLVAKKDDDTEEVTSGDEKVVESMSMEQNNEAVVSKMVDDKKIKVMIANDEGHEGYYYKGRNVDDESTEEEWTSCNGKEEKSILMEHSTPVIPEERSDERSDEGTDRLKEKTTEREPADFFSFNGIEEHVDYIMDMNNLSLIATIDSVDILERKHPPEEKPDERLDEVIDQQEAKTSKKEPAQFIPINELKELVGNSEYGMEMNNLSLVATIDSDDNLERAESFERKTGGYFSAEMRQLLRNTVCCYTSDYVL